MLLKISGVHSFNREGKGISLELGSSHWSEFKRADQVGLSASKLLIIKMQAALTYVRSNCRGRVM